MTRILCPRASGVLAALGLVVSERRRDAQRSVLLAGDELTDEALESEANALAERAREQLGDDEAPVRVTAELRYRGQAFELAVDAGRRPDGLREDFHAAHEEAYGYRDPEAEVELVTLRATATEPGPDVDAAAAGAQAAGVERSTRTAIFGGEEHETRCWPASRSRAPRSKGRRSSSCPRRRSPSRPAGRGEVLESGTIRMERS